MRSVHRRVRIASNRDRIDDLAVESIDRRHRAVEVGDPNETYSHDRRQRAAPDTDGVDHASGGGVYHRHRPVFFVGDPDKTIGYVGYPHEIVSDNRCPRLGADRDRDDVVCDRIDESDGVVAAIGDHYEIIGGGRRERPIPTVIVSIAIGDSCPYCEDLDGTVRSKSESFLQAGKEFQPAGADRPLTTSFDLSHPPYHAGCDCTIGPG